MVDVVSVSETDVGAIGTIGVVPVDMEEEEEEDEEVDDDVELGDALVVLVDVLDETELVVVAEVLAGTVLLILELVGLAVATGWTTTTVVLTPTQPSLLHSKPLAQHPPPPWNSGQEVYPSRHCVGVFPAHVPALSGQQPNEPPEPN